MTEPTEEVVAVAHKGFVAFEAETEGRAAHGSRPDLGIDAIAAMGAGALAVSPSSTGDCVKRTGTRCSGRARCTPR